MKTVTRNEYIEFVQQCADRYWREDNYTWDDYMEDTDERNFQILPFDLSMYTDITPEIKKWINILFREEDTDRHGKYMLRGFTQNVQREHDILQLTYGDYANYYSGFCYSDAGKMIYTYCEGDTTLQMYSDRNEYEHAKAETLAWYQEHCG